MPSIFLRALAVARTRLSVARRRRDLPVPLGTVDFGILRRTEPISRVFGLDRGTPIDDYQLVIALRATKAGAE